MIWSYVLIGRLGGMPADGRSVTFVH